MSIQRPTENANITVYAPGPSYVTPPTLSCTNAGTITASISPGSCGGGGSGCDVGGSFFVTSYSYTKDDAIMPGQESWSLVRWVAAGGTPAPDPVMRGYAEGAATPNAGVSFDTIDASSCAGSVSAGGIGRADTMDMGTVSSVGGGSSSTGDTGQGSVSIPYTPLWLGGS